MTGHYMYAYYLVVCNLLIWHTVHIYVILSTCKLMYNIYSNNKRDDDVAEAIYSERMSYIISCI